MNTQNTTPVSDKKIIGIFTKQVWGGHKNDVAQFVEDVKFDATTAILLMDYGNLINLTDYSEDTDQIGFDHIDWSGPCEVYLCGSICKFFDVEKIKDITEEKFNAVKNSFNLKPPTTRSIMLSIRVKVDMAQNSGELSDLIENLDYSIRSQTPGMVIIDTEIVDSDPCN
jgi:hypothetical protein